MKKTRNLKGSKAKKKPGKKAAKVSVLTSILKPSLKVLSNARSLNDFIEILTDDNPEVIQGYANEIKENREFHEILKKNRKRYRGGSFFSWFPSIGTMLGTMIYALCRSVKPDKVVETGVASGVSSSYILCALEENGHGKLYSIDVPWDKQSGWIVPDYLRHRWLLDKGRSSEKLPSLLERLRAIDIFLHDSDHSYRNMLWEYQTAWKYLSDEGLLLSHNVDENNAFPDFCESVGLEGFLLTNMGGVVKT